jgi:hypothetical protein
MIPLILGAVALGSAAYGALKGAEGVNNMSEATKTGEDAQKRHELAVKQLQQNSEATNKLAADYGQLQLDVLVRTISRFVAFIERNGQQASQSTKKYLEGLEVTVQQIEAYKAAALEAQQVFQGGTAAAGAATVGYSGAMGLATSVGAASTGTAIGSLSGAAAWNATLAWLGGGSLAAGGGGMALGSVVLGGITVGPAVLFGGFVLAGEGEKALTKAREYACEANKAIANIHIAQDFLKEVNKRIDELSTLVSHVNSQAILGLNELESREPFDKNRDAHQFQRVALLIKALAEILKTPLLNDEGKINIGTVTILEKYRNL